MFNRIIGIFVAFTATTASANDDLNRYINERAASCWTTPIAMRGITFKAEVHVSFTKEGHVGQVEIGSVVPDTETFRALAVEFSDALKRCGPYTTEAMSEMTLTLAWPL
jgi:hypothetical protein